MDFSAFSHPSFDPVEWIDGMIAQQQQEEEENNDQQLLDTYITSLTMKLHVVTQDYTDQLEAAMVDASSMIPRTLTETTRSQNILKNLENEMSSLAVQLQEFDQRNISGVEDLSRLDTLKLNMEKCKATLEEHARWSQLVREAKSLLDSGGRFSDSADRIEILSNSLNILENMPGHEDRLKTYNSLTETLLSSLQPLVLQEVMGNNMSSLRESLYVYNKIKRSHEFVDIYTTYRPQKLENACNECFKSSTTTPTQIPIFYGQIYGFITEESENIAALFGEDEVSDLLCILLEKIMTPLQSAMAQRYTASDYSTVEEFSKRLAPLLVTASDENLFKGLSSVYSCFLQNINMLLNTEGKNIRVILQNSVDSLKLHKLSEKETTNSLTDTGMDFEDEDNLDTDDVTLLFENFGISLATTVGESCENIKETLVKSLAFLGGLRSRRFLRFLVPLLSQHLKSLTAKVDELHTAAGLTKSNIGDKSTAGLGSSITQDLKRFGIEDLGASKGRVLLPSALQVFKAASIMNQQFLVLERTASEQLERVYGQLYNDYSLKDVVYMISTSSESEKGGKGAYSAIVSKNASVSIGSTLAASILRQDQEADSELKAYLIASTRLTASSVTQSVFSASLTSLIKFKSSAEEYLFHLMVFAPESFLKDLHLDQCWRAHQQIEDGSIDAEDDVIDEDNLLPQQVFTQVGEHLLSLLQELESFATANAVSDFIRLQDDADTLISEAWKPLRKVLELSDDESYRSLSKKSKCYLTIAKAEQAMYGVSTSTEGIVDLSVGNVEPTMIETDDVDEDDDVLRFVNEWLGAVSDYSVGILVVQICQISKLTALGRAQLRVDLAYLNNVINALGISRHPLLSHLEHLLEQDMDRITTQIDFIPVTTSPLLAVHKVISRVIDATKNKE